MILACLLYDCHFNWRFLRLNSWADCVAISTDITRHGSNSVFLVHEEDIGSLDSKIIFFSLEVCALPSMTHLHKTANLK